MRQNKMIMRSLVLLGALFFWGNSFAQISLSVNKQTIKQIIPQIEKASGYNVFYTDKLPNLATLQKENQQTQVLIESNLNLKKIEEEAKSKLGMQRLTNDQKIYMNLPKKDYVQSSTDKAKTTEEKNWLDKIMDKFKGN